MATFNPTPSQQRAIDDRGKNILVSASAGSGKTVFLCTASRSMRKTTGKTGLRSHFVS